jgi:plastocyanin
MVFAVNPTSAAQFAAFQAAANATANNTSATATASVITVTETVTVSAGASSTGSETFTTTYGSYPGSAAPTVATSTDHRVIVGGSTLTYNPSNITAQPGDTITFEFHGKNHTVTQSSFATPCEALSLTGGVGFDSGL